MRWIYTLLALSLISFAEVYANDNYYFDDRPNDSEKQEASAACSIAVSAAHRGAACGAKDCFGRDVCVPPIACPQYCDPCLARDAQEARVLSKACCVPGTWFPQLPPLFRPFIADPRAVTASAALRYNDKAIADRVAAVSYGDIFSIYRWYDRWPWCGQLEFGLEGALWAVFDPITYSAPLVNADYFIGGFFTYAYKCWQFRFRAYHISSHIGDEFLLNHPCFDRRNPSAEYIELFASWYIVDEIRLYAGIGGVAHQDPSFKIGRWYWEGGMEVRVYELGFIDCGSRLYGTPFYAMHFRLRKDYKEHVDQTYALGYEWGATYGTGKRFRGYLEYHDGYSAEGQFSRIATNYLSFKISYGF